MKAAWLQAVEKAFPQGHAPRFPGYPLLGSELSGDPSLTADSSPWRLRVALVEPLDSDQCAALLEDVEELRLSGELVGADVKGALAKGELSSDKLELYCEQETGAPAWRLLERHTVAVGPWAAERSVWAREGKSVVEQSLVLDSMVLKNLAALRAAMEKAPEVDRWVVSSSVSASQETEALIADTVAYLTGAVAGATVLEVIQQPGERFETVWARLNICRLLRWEAELGQPGDALTGAGLFAELGDRLHTP